METLWKMCERRRKGDKWTNWGKKCIMRYVLGRERRQLVTQLEHMRHWSYIRMNCDFEGPLKYYGTGEQA